MPEKTVDETGFPLAPRPKDSANKTDHGSCNQHVKNSPRHSQIPRRLLNSYISVMLPPMTRCDSRYFLPEDEFVVNKTRRGDSVSSKARNHLRSQDIVQEPKRLKENILLYSKILISGPLEELCSLLIRELGTRGSRVVILGRVKQCVHYSCHSAPSCLTFLIC